MQKPEPKVNVVFGLNSPIEGLEGLVAVVNAAVPEEIQHSVRESITFDLFDNSRKSKRRLSLIFGPFDRELKSCSPALRDRIRARKGTSYAGRGSISEILVMPFSSLPSGHRAMFVAEFVGHVRDLNQNLLTQAGTDGLSGALSTWVHSVSEQVKVEIKNTEPDRFDLIFHDSDRFHLPLMLSVFKTSESPGFRIELFCSTMNAIQFVYQMPADQVLALN